MTKKEETIKAMELLIKKYKWLVENAEPIDNTGLIARVWISQISIHEKTLKRIKEDNKEKWFLYNNKFDPSKNCPLCKIHMKQYRRGTYIFCNGCPLANRNRISGCTPMYKNSKRMIKGRIDFLTNKLEKIKAIPEKYFTIRGWKYEAFNK